jgi:hypothetical protein
VLGQCDRLLRIATLPPAATSPPAMQSSSPIPGASLVPIRGPGLTVAVVVTGADRGLAASGIGSAVAQPGRAGGPLPQ